MILAISSADFYPIEFLFGICELKDKEIISLPNNRVYWGDWGQAVYLTEDLNSVNQIHIVYYSILEAKFYELKASLGEQHIEAELITIGLGLYGFCQLWITESKKQSLSDCFNAIECNQKVHKYFSNHPEIKDAWYLDKKSDSARSDQYLEILDSRIQEHFNKVGLPPTSIVKSWMQQYCYRYIVKLEKWDEQNQSWSSYEDPKEEAIYWFLDESLFDGTYNKLHEDNLFKYHMAGKPKKIRIKWSAYDYYFNCFIWFDEDMLTSLFNQIFETNPDIHVDFIFHFDYTCNKYQILLYRYGLDNPIIMPENAYQILVFKESKEFYVSENYNQKHNAWYW